MHSTRMWRVRGTPSVYGTEPSATLATFRWQDVSSSDLWDVAVLPWSRPRPSANSGAAVPFFSAGNCCEGVRRQWVRDEMLPASEQVGFATANGAERRFPLPASNRRSSQVSDRYAPLRSGARHSWRQGEPQS